MIVLMENTIVLTDPERMELNQRAASRSGRADDARRARLMLLLETGHTWAAVRDKLDCNDAFIDRWSKRFREERLAGLFSRHAGQEASTLTPALEARILEWTLKRRPSDGATQWSTRRLGTQLKISHMRVSRVWAKHGLNPRRHCARRVHVGARLAEKAHEVHPALQQRAKDSKVALLRSYASHYSQFSCYSPLVDGTVKDG